MAGAGLKNNLGQNVCSFTSGSALRIPNVEQGWFFLEIYGKQAERLAVTRLVKM